MHDFKRQEHINIVACPVLSWLRVVKTRHTISRVVRSPSSPLLSPPPKKRERNYRRTRNSGIHHIRFRGLVDEELPVLRPRRSDIFMRLGVVLRPKPRAFFFLLMNPRNGRDAVRCNLLRREMLAWLAPVRPPCLRSAMFSPTRCPVRIFHPVHSAPRCRGEGWCRARSNFSTSSFYFQS